VDGETHGFWWCVGHTFGINQTQHEIQVQADQARQALAQMHGFTINGQSPADFAKNANNQQAIQGLRQADTWLGNQSLSPCDPGIACGVILPPVGAEFGAIEEAEIVNAERGGTALAKWDAAHRSTSFVTENVVEHGQRFWITGNDGKRRLLIQLGGQELNGTAGRYEIIYDPETKSIPHQMFVKGGVVNGQPIKPQ